MNTMNNNTNRNHIDTTTLIPNNSNNNSNNNIQNIDYSPLITNNTSSRIQTTTPFNSHASNISSTSASLSNTSMNKNNQMNDMKTNHALDNTTSIRNNIQLNGIRQHKFRYTPNNSHVITNNNHYNNNHNNTTTNNNNNNNNHNNTINTMNANNTNSTNNTSMNLDPISTTSVIWRPSTPPANKSFIQQQQSLSSSSIYMNQYHPSFINKEEESYRLKSKSQKLLCLWPLPVMTRSIILVSILISALNAFQWIELTCSSPKNVIYRHDVINLILSPFLFHFTLHGLILFGWNCLILGLFEESLSQPLGGTRKFVSIFTCITFLLYFLRQLFGYLFTKSTGWAVPSLFFSNAIHECNQGLAPFLFALLIIQSVSIDDKYILIFGDDEHSNYKLTIRKVTLQLMMLLINYTEKNILWWSLTGLITGFIVTIILQTTYLAREEDGYYYLIHPTNDQENGTFIPYQEKNHHRKTWNTLLDPYRRTPLWRILWTAILRCMMMMIMTLPILFICNAYYNRDQWIDDKILNQQIGNESDDYLFTFIIMTAPRKNDPPFLTQTIQSYLDQWPSITTSSSSSLYDRIRIMVYTHFSNHTEYDKAHDQFSKDDKGKKYVQWVKEDGNLFNHRLHLTRALELATSSSLLASSSSSFESYTESSIVTNQINEITNAYIVLLEDDFPICGQRAWQEMKTIIYQANQQLPNHCGIFVGTGGSGLFLKPEIATILTSQRLLYTYANQYPPDIIIQKCLLGELKECQMCSQSLVASKTLLMHHIGYNASTSADRKYKKDEFQCNWRHPFNGDPDVTIF
ncbi:unnamed protein product [Cunninghamella blakesleeana]